MSEYVGLKTGNVHERTELSEYYCARCGYPVTDHDSYCRECGGAFLKSLAYEMCDYDALLALADEMEQAGKEYRYQANENAVYSDLIDDAPEEFIEYARRIREALGEVEK